MSRICVPLMASDVAGLIGLVPAARAAGADMLELRLDHLAGWTADSIRGLLRAVRAAFPGPMIATCRLAAEGGHYAGDEPARIELLRLAAREGADFIDLEYQSWRALPEAVRAGLQTDLGRGGKLILSRHDFERTPADPGAIFAELLATPADVVKLACRADAPTDALRMLDALRAVRGAREAIALSMGEAGIMTRVLAGKFGGLLTFAALDAGRESAPGQPTVRELRELYRWESIRESTRVYGVIGCPVGHSMSPAIHNAAFGRVGHDGVYLPFRVEPAYETFAEFLDGCLSRPWLDLRGLSVTIPHKENLLRYARERGGLVEPLTARIGVANTLHVEPQGIDAHRSAATPPLYAFNTDYRGALEALCNGLSCRREDLAGQEVAVLGAGGVARAIVAGLCDCGCKVTIYNRTRAKAVALAEEFGAAAADWDQRVRPGTRIIINCTSIGMWPNIADTPFDLSRGDTLRGGKGETPTCGAAGRPEAGGTGGWPASEQPAVFDTVYNPIETRLLSEARRAGCRTIDGVAMFVGQAAAQFERWTGRPAPVDLMRDVVVRRLAHVAPSGHEEAQNS